MIPPILNASGCLDAHTAPGVAERLDAFVTKTVTPLPREGNPPPRIAETTSGMLNSIGLQNPGIDAFLRDKLPRLATLGVPIWVSVGGFSADDYALLCARLDECEDVTTIELNLSCPNVEEAPETAAELVTAARGATGKPLYAKLSPATWDVAESARAVAAAGSDGLSLVNTIRGLGFDPTQPATRTRPRGRRLLRPRPCDRSPSPACTRAPKRSSSPSSAWEESPRDAMWRTSSAPVRARSRSERFSSPIPGRLIACARSSKRPALRAPTRCPARCPNRSSDTCVARSANSKTPANRLKRFGLTAGASLVDSSGSWSRRRRTRRRLRAPSIRGWRRSSGRTTFESAARS